MPFDMIILRQSGSRNDVGVACALVVSSGINKLLNCFILLNNEITVPKEPKFVDLNVAAIAGGVVGGVSVVVLVVLRVYLYLR